MPFKHGKHKKTVSPAAKVRTVKKRRKLERVLFAVAVAIAALAVVFFIWARSQGQLSVSENAIGSVLSPVVNAANAATEWTRDLIGGIRDQQAAQKENAALQLENEKLKYQIADLESLRSENERLTALLGAQETYESLDPIFARVIARDAGLWFDAFTLNVGTTDGVAVNMAVVTGDGLVGRVYEVGLNYAKVMSIIDTRSAVACIIERTRDNGVMKGQYENASYDGGCFLYYIPSVNDIIPGDTVITSGVDGLYPKGLYVGLVRAVSRQSDTSDQYVIVNTGADFQRLEEVLVLRTLVETAGDTLPSVPDPTLQPRQFTASPSASPAPGETPAATDNGNFAYPTVAPEPTPTPEPVGLVEDAWAEG